MLKGRSRPFKEAPQLFFPLKLLFLSLFPFPHIIFRAPHLRPAGHKYNIIPPGGPRSRRRSIFPALELRIFLDFGEKICFNIDKIIYLHIPEYFLMRAQGIRAQA